MDESLKPWLIEVNRSPSLSFDCEVDRLVKKPMLHHLFDLLGYPKVPIPDIDTNFNRSEAFFDIDNKNLKTFKNKLIYFRETCTDRSSIGKLRQRSYSCRQHRDKYCKDILNSKSIEYSSSNSNYVENITDADLGKCRSRRRASYPQESSIYRKQESSSYRKDVEQAEIIIPTLASVISNQKCIKSSVYPRENYCKNSVNRLNYINIKQKNMVAKSSIVKTEDNVSVKKSNFDDSQRILQSAFKSTFVSPDNKLKVNDISKNESRPKVVSNLFKNEGWKKLFPFNPVTYHCMLNPPKVCN